MWRHWVMRGSVVSLALLSSGPSWAANAFVRYFARQKVGQEITITGHFYRFHYKRQFFRRNDKTGDVQYFDYYGMALTPTQVVGNGSFAQEARRIDTVLLLYPDEELVKHIPDQGENLWFTGTLLGYQYGISGIVNSVYSGGDPYILLKRVSTQLPQESVPPTDNRSSTP